MTTAPTAILADDLTGACDSAGPFAAHGKRAWVTWNTKSFGEPGADLVSACSESRNDDAKSAAQKARRATQALRSLGATWFFKKVDSTLRGNWLTETAAVLDELRRKAAVVAPAFPAMGRQMVGGQLILNGDPQVDQPSSVAQLETHTLARARYVTLPELRKGPTNLVKLVSQNQHDERLFFVDGEIDGDLDIVAEAVESIAESVLAVGSAGLATSLARRTTFMSNSPTFVEPPLRTEHRSQLPRRTSRVAVIFVGSSNQGTHSQVKALRESCVAGEFELNDSPVEKVEECLKQGASIVVHVRWQQGPISAMKRLLEVCQRGEPTSFVLTGGDTAQLVCTCCDARGIWINGEINPGLPWGQLCGGPFDDVRVATKAGGFGGPDSLMRIVEFLTGRESRHTNPFFG